MHKSELDLLIDPVSKAPVVLHDAVERGGEIIEGVLLSGGRRYLIRNGIARMVSVVNDVGQRQTQESFGYKWRQQSTYTSPSVTSAFEDWQVSRYGFQTAEEMRRYFGTRWRVLDAGCGGGMSTSNWMAPGWRQRLDAEWYGIDISEAIDVAKERLGHHEGTHFVQADVLQLPFRAGAFDTIFSEGVMHHTPSTRAALASLAGVLAPGGELLFYVYRKKGPLREFADDWIRQHISSLDPAEAWEALRPLTALGKALAELHAEVDLPLDIPYLGIKAGRHDVQRLVYWHFLKLFWNEAFSFDENNHVNFDWYHPRYAHRQTEEEVRQWCEELTLEICHFDRQESGFTVRAIKQASTR
jgi:arsenite methyltransferase